MSREEELLTALLDGETVETFTPRSRFEHYLKCCINKSGVENCPKPISRADVLLYALACKMCGVEVGGGTEQMNGEFEYSENLTDGEVTSYSIKGIGSVTNTDLVFPETYNGKPVTELNPNAFMENTTITSIVIPDSYTSIGMNCFRGCTALESAVIGNGITGIGTNVFLYAELKRVKFGNSITRITSYAFNGCPLELLDFREATVVPTLDDGTIFVGMAEGCQIVVPDALYDEWATATRWSDLEEATYVKASEYTEV